MSIRIGPPDPVKSQQSGHKEAWAPWLAVALANGEKLDAQGLKWASWLPARWDGYDELLGEGSWNHVIMEAAAAVWYGSSSAVDWLLLLLRYQTADPKPDGTRWAPPAGQEILARLGGSETTSADYEPLRQGSYALFRLWAIRHGDEPRGAEVLRLTTRYAEIQAALMALMAVPWPDADAYRSSSGMYWTGPTISPTGERSPIFFQHDLGTALCHYIGRPEVSKHAGWPAAAILECGDWQVPSAPTIRAYLEANGADPAPILSLLAGATVNASFHIARYPEGLAVWKDGIYDHNTVPCPGTVALDETQRMQILWPWGTTFAEIRHNIGDCAVTVEGGRLVCRSNRPEVSLDLPTSPQLWHVVADTAGIRIEWPAPATPVDPPAPAPPPATPDHSVPPPATGPDLGAIADVVERLQLGRSDRPLQAAIVRELRSAEHRSLPEIADDLARLGIGDGQEQAEGWRQAIAALRGA